MSNIVPIVGSNLATNTDLVSWRKKATSMNRP